MNRSRSSTNIHHSTIVDEDNTPMLLHTKTNVNCRRGLARCNSGIEQHYIQIIDQPNESEEPNFWFLNDINALFVDKEDEEESKESHPYLSKASGETNCSSNSKVSFTFGNNINNNNNQDDVNDSFCLIWNDKDKEDDEGLVTTTMTTTPITTITPIAKMQKDIIALAKEQLSCRELQEEVLGNKLLASQYFKEILNTPGALYDLIIHPFGNYFIQILINMIDEELKKELLINIESSFLDISINFYGTRVLQNLIDTNKSNSLMTLLIKISAHCMANMVMNINSSHIIFSLLSLKQPNITKAILDQIQLYLMSIATDKHGSCFIQKIIQSDPQASANIIQLLINNSISLLTHQFGHYTIRYVFSMKNPYYNYSLISLILPHFIQLSNHKFSSTVLEKCFEVCDAYSINLLYNVIISNPSHVIISLLVNQFGNYVLQKAIDTAYPNLQCYLLNMLAPAMFALKRDTYGKQLFSKICIKYPSVKTMVNLMKSKGGFK